MAAHRTTGTEVNGGFALVLTGVGHLSDASAIVHVLLLGYSMRSVPSIASFAGLWRYSELQSTNIRIHEYLRIPDCRS